MNEQDMPLVGGTAQRVRPDIATCARTIQEDGVCGLRMVQRLDVAHALILAGRIDDGLQLLMEQHSECCGYFDGQYATDLRVRRAYLRGLASLVARQPLRAQEHLLTALAQARPGSADEVRCRQLLGVSFQQAEQPGKAFREHNLALRLIMGGDNEDPGLRVGAYLGIADALFALNECHSAAQYYRMTLAQLSEAAYPASYAAALAGMGRSYYSTGKHSRALLYFRRAREIYCAQGDNAATSQLTIEIAQTMIGQRRISAAANELQGLEQRLAGGHALLLCSFQRQQAELYLAQGLLDEASSAVQTSLALGLEWLRNSESGQGGPIYPRSTVALAYQTAARVAEQQADYLEADRLFGVALGWLADTEMMEVRLAIQRSYGDVLTNRGDFVAAVDCYRQALLCHWF